jgi:ATP-binding cassette subfamily F protein uup
MSRGPVQKGGARPPIAALRGVRLADGALQLFDGVDLGLEARVRACLVGRNGAGKSTLLKVLAGQIEADDGERFLQPGTRIAFVPQEPVVAGETLADFASSGGAERHEAEAGLEAFGLDPARDCKGLSGGEIRRAALAKAFAEAPDLILLDEPTNHLDILAIETLERTLAASRSAALIVSHDRAFLERTTSRCFWLAHRKVRTLDKGFGAFEAWADKVEAEEAENLRRLEKTIEREAYAATRSITARRTRNEGRARALAVLRQTKTAILKDQTRPLEMALDSGGVSGKLVAEAKGIAKTYGPRTLVRGFSTRIIRGDRVAIVGPNGAGKTTLVKLLLGEIAADEGTVRLGTGLEIAYLDQARAELAVDATLWDVLAPGGGDQLLVRGRPKHVAAYAKEFLFKDSQLRQPVASLSGGERNRLLLARALTKPANLLVLDEPTNDLDIETLDLLEEMLADYEGTLLLVSHDRDFIDRLATSTIALDGRGRVAETPGGWQDFMRQNPGFFTEPSRTVAAAPEKKAPAPAEAPRPKAAKLSYKDQRRLEELEALVARLPGEIAAQEERLHDPGLYARDPAGFDKLMKSLDAARATLAAAEDEWMALEEKREALGG